MVATGKADSQGAGERGLRFGVTAAGLVFTHQPAVPEDLGHTISLLRELRGPSLFVVRLNRLYWSGGQATLDRIVAETERFAAEGLAVSLQLRYGGPGEHLPEGGPQAFAAWTRQVVRVASNDALVGVEVTNEPNLTIAPDNSDGAFAEVKDALIAGVLAASEEADRRPGPRIPVGFNWFHHTGPDEEGSFWSYLGEHGGERLGAALDWVGLNIYPGTYDFTAVPPGEEGAEVERALELLRGRYLPIVSVPPETPIRVTEFGWPDGEGRTQEEQSRTLHAMVSVLERGRDLYNVTDAYWFNLRDSDSSRAKNESHYGLVTSDYVEKPSFAEFRSIVRAAASV